MHYLQQDGDDFHKLSLHDEVMYPDRRNVVFVCPF